MGEEPTRVWDGFQWVEVEVPKIQKERHYLSGKESGPAAEAQVETLEAQRRLVLLQREMRSLGAQRSRVEFMQRKQATARAVRDQMDELVGKAAIRQLTKVRPAEEDEVREIAARLNQKLLGERNMDMKARSSAPEKAQEAKMWIRLWREMDDEGLGRINFDQFSAMLRGKLCMRAKTRKDRHELEKTLQGLWRYMDDDEEGEVKGYIVLSDLIGFLKLGLPQQGEEEEDPTSGQQSWRERLTAQKKRDAAALREQRRQQIEACELMADLGEWQQQMGSVHAATEAQLREVSCKLNTRLGDKGWYSLFKAMDVSGDARISWREFLAMARQKALADDALLRRLWKALDGESSGFISLSVFSSFMRLGSQTRLTPPSIQHQGAIRSRVSADVGLREARESDLRQREKVTARLNQQADELEMALTRMKRGGDVKSPRRLEPLPPAKTDRRHYQYGEPRNLSQLLRPEEINAMEYRRMCATSRRVHERVSKI